MTQDQKFENMEFYGKKISEMEGIEIGLLMNDLLLLVSMEYMTNGKTDTIKLFDRKIDLGTPTDYLVKAKTRVELLKDMFDIQDTSDDMVIILTEMSQYSFETFLKNIKEKIKNGEFSMDNPFQFFPKFEYNFSMN